MFEPKPRTHLSTHSPLALILSILLLTSLACTLPGLGLLKASPTPLTITSTPQTVTPAAQVRKPAGPLPPALVETDPQPGSSLPAKGSVTLYFNQPMEHAAVEAALQGQPALSGKFNWVDDATVRFQPDQPFQPDVPVNLTLGTGARAVNGQALPAPVNLSFQSAGPLNVTARVPAPGSMETDPSSSVVVTFNRPIVSLGAEASSLPSGFTLEPAVQGRGEWLNTSTYIFYPDPALKGGIQYQVKLNSALTSTDGSPLSLEGLDPAEWGFSTSLPVVTGIKPQTEGKILLDQEFEITFNQPMARESTQNAFRLVGQGRAPVTGLFSWDERHAVAKFKPGGLLTRGSNYTLTLSSEAKNSAGMPLANEFSQTFTTVSSLTPTLSVPANGEPLETYDGFGSITIDFGVPLAKQRLQDLITLDPPVGDISMDLTGDATSVVIGGYYKPSTPFTVNLSSNLIDRWGERLATPIKLSFNSGPAKPSLNIPIRQAGASAIFVPTGQTYLEARATNLSFIQLANGKLSLDDFVQIDNTFNWPSDWSSRIEQDWKFTPALSRDQSQAVKLPLRPDGKTLEPGLYFYFANAPELGGTNIIAPSPTLLVSSRVQMTLKVSQSQAFIWAVDTDKNEPLSGAEATVFSGKDMATLGSCTTNAKGTCQVEFSPRSETYETLYARIGQPGDANFSLISTNWNQGLINGWTQDETQPLVYLYTDRPIYRPGQTVNFRVVVRNRNNGRYSLVDLKEINLRVMPSYNFLTSDGPAPITTLRLPLSSYGTASGSFTLPLSADPGIYSLEVSDFENVNLAFQVANYRKPQFELKAAFEKPDCRCDEQIKAFINSDYYFGAPAGGLAVSWSLYAHPDWMTLPGGYQTGKVQPFWQDNFFMFDPLGQFVLSGTGETAPDGSMTLIIPTAQLRALDLDQRQILTLEVTATDESNQAVSVRTQMVLHPADFYVGLRADSWTASAGEELGFAIQTVNWSGAVSSDHDLRAVFSKAEWNQDNTDADPFNYSRFQPTLTEISSTNLRTDGQGRARVAFTPPDPGVYWLSVSGGGTVTELLIWVSGPGSAPWPSLPNQHIQLTADAAEYTAGQTAHIRIPNPFSGKVLALVTVERSKVMYSEVIELDSSTFDYALALDELDAPNVYVSVQLLTRLEDGAIDFRQGLLDVKVRPDAELLTLSLSALPNLARPGQEVNLNLQANDAAGKPVQGEFSLALVDKAVLALADPNSQNITDFFYGHQQLAVRAATSQAVYSGRIPALRPGRGGGGGGDMMNQSSTRTQFVDTAAWNGALETDANGKAEVKVKLPDNLTTWVANVRGLTTDTRVGQANLELMTSKELIVRPVTPRFLVAGDHVQMAAILQNNSDRSLTVQVEMDSVGLTLDDPAGASQTVDVPSRGRKEVTWWTTVQEIDAVDLTFSAKSGSFEDVTRLEQGSLPVLHYSAPQTFGTGGLLTDAGQRLEVISLPRSFKATSAQLTMELSPSLASSVLAGLQSLENYPDEYTEPVVSRLLPNLAMYRALKQFNLQAPDLQQSLEENIHKDLTRLSEMRTNSNGWSWNGSMFGQNDPYLTAYVLFTFSQAVEAGFYINPDMEKTVQEYLVTTLYKPELSSDTWQYDQLAFIYFSLQQSGQTNLNVDALYTMRDRLSPWSKALLAVTLEDLTPGDARAKTLISDLESSAERSSTGVSWQKNSSDWHNWSTPNFTTGVVSYALAKLDPASPLLTDAARYLVLQRQPARAWGSSYESAWALLGLVETLRSTGDLQANFNYQADLNGIPLATGSPKTPASALNPITAQAGLKDLLEDTPNALTISREAGEGRLYYRAFLQVNRPAEEAQPVQKGIFVSREYFTANCDLKTCPGVQKSERGLDATLVARITLTVPKDMYYVAVEDTFPAGMDVIDPNLKTSTQGHGQELQQPEGDPAALFGEGWGWWYFASPKITDQGLRWVAPYLPAGTYQLTYRLVPGVAGEFRTLPAHAYEVYFPDVEGSSAGGIFEIK